MEFLERDEHLRRLSAALAKAAEGRGRIVAIAGAAGAGKTTLVERFAREQSTVARVYAGACENLSTPEPLLPLRDIARANGMAFDLSQGHLAAFETVLELLTQGGKPALLILEDVHWADAATLDLIRFLVRRIAQVKALVLATYRDDELGTRSALLDVLGEAPAGSVERMALESLSLSAVSRLAKEAGRSGEKLYDLTGGNPFMVTEALAVEIDATPETVRDATLARAARLPPDGRAVLEAVSIFPRCADLEIVAALVESEVDKGLDACAERRMLSVDGNVLKFRHELARRAVEGSLSLSRRRSLHRKAVEALKSATGARASEIAHHAELAGDIATLLTFARRAGEAAARAGSPREAAAHFAAMLRYREALGPELTAATLEQHAEQSYLMGASDVAKQSMGEAAEMRRAMDDAIGLGRDLTKLTRYSWVCGQRTDAERYIAEAVAVLEMAGTGPELAWAYSHQSQLDMLASKPDSAIRLGERALALAEKLGAREIFIHALGNVSTARMERDGPAAVAGMERSLALARAEGLHDHVERASCNLACGSYWWREYRKAFDYIETGVAYAVKHGLAHWEAYLRGWRAMALLDQGNWQASEMDSQTVSGWRGVPDLYRSPALFALARLRVRRGDPDVETPLDTGRKVIASLGELQRDGYPAVIDAERAWLARGVNEEPQGGHSNAPTHGDGDIVERLRDVHMRAVERNLHWLIEDTGLWLYLLGEPVAAANLSPPFRAHCSGRWRDAADAWRGMGCPYEEALALGEGDEEAQREALTILDRLGAAPAAARLRRLMRMAGIRTIPRGPTAGTRANSAGLTRRQAQVLALVADGLSNPEIADRLCISAKTAEHHVSAIMGRLEVPTRRGAAAAARKLGLLDAPKI
jgi:DNA-binding CsgD family transcriptional regulator/tetratricopeptide (TPR) repeat protein